MESNDAVHALSGLARETRLANFRDPVQTGPGGRAAGEIARRFDLPGATLSLHLSQLSRCGLLRSRRAGRGSGYTVDFEYMARRMNFLTGKLLWRRGVRVRARRCRSAGERFG